MDYTQFREKIDELGGVSIPTPEQKEKLIEGENSMHFILHGFTNSINMEIFVSAIELIKSRGAMREGDWTVTADMKVI